MSSSHFIISEEDEEIEKAKALSLITASEDEVRRCQLYHPVETIPQHVANERTSEGLRASSSYPNLTEDSTSSATTNTIARPRPQGKVVGNNTLNLPIVKPKVAPRSPRTGGGTRHVPVVPPRPSKMSVSPPSQRLSGHCVDTVGHPDSTKSTDLPPRPKEKTQAKHVPHHQNMHNRSPTPQPDTDKPLIMLSPPILPNPDDFDVSSLDPLNSVKPCSSGATSSRTSFGTDIHVTFNPPGSRTVPFTVTGTNQRPLFASSSSFGMAATLPYSPGGSTSSVSATMSYTPHGSTSSGSVAPSYPLRGSTGTTSTSSYICGSASSVSATPSVPPTGPFYPPSDGTFIGNKGRDNSLFSNSALFDMTAPTMTHQADRLGNFDTTLSYPQTDDVSRDVNSACCESDNNLMQFAASDDHDEFLSLESFDPLYSMEQLSLPDDVANTTDSIELFPNPYDRFERKETPNPFPVIHVASTQKLLQQSGVHMTPRLSQDVTNDMTVDDPPDTSAAMKGHTRNISTGSNTELMDPFSVSNLTKVLEQKRRKHDTEMNERASQMKKKEAKLKEEEKAGRQKFMRQTSYLSKEQEVTYENLHDSGETPDEEIQAFCQMVGRLTRQYKPRGDKSTMGLVMSRKLAHIPTTLMEVKVIVMAKFLKDPFTFTWNLNASVDKIISSVLFSITDDLGSISTDEYIIKVHGLSEYFSNDSALGEYEYVQQCMKLDQDIRLILCDVAKVPKSFRRTAEDDKHVVFVPKAREVDEAMRVTKEKLNILMETFYKEVEKLRDHAIQGQRIQSSGVVQAVKAISMTLCKIETIDIMKATRRLLAASRDMSDGSSIGGRRSNQLDSLHMILEDLTRSVKCMIELYCRTYHTDFRFESITKISRDNCEKKKDVKEYSENLLIHISTVHRIPQHWLSQYEDFKVRCDIYYGGKRLAEGVETTNKPSACGGLPDTIVWDEWLQFETVFLDCLPREARLAFTVIGVKTMHAGSANEIAHKVRTPLGWVALQVFNHKFELVQGSQLLGLWNGDQAKPMGTTVSNTDHPSSILLQVNLPEFDNIIIFPDITNRLPSMKQDFHSLHPDDQEQLQSILEKDTATRLSPAESEVIWEKRHYLYQKPEALPRVLQAAHSWDWSNLAEIYTMMKDWKALKPLQAFELLLPSYADTYVRTAALNFIRDLSYDELLDYLPQLVQAFKFESYHTAALAQFLLEQSIASVRVAHQLYWVIKEAAEDVHFKKRYHLLFGALLSVVGIEMRHELSREEDFVRMLSAVADKVKTAKDKLTVLQTELAVIGDFLQPEDTVRLPLNPAMEVMGFDVKSCSFFSSNTFPLRLVMRNVDLQAESVYTMFKVGDDLRQDMLTMQLIGIMDRLWLQHGLDLKIITFKCQATAAKKGLIELITDSETLRKIQVRHGHGLAGSFRDHSIAEWLQTQNPTELDYQKAVDNFTSSCAGYCVATYLLGICDRHNDNIMIKHTGHMFHIDFGKFLGDSQMFGNFKRDRVPFVLTADMAYVINGGDKSSCKFQEFVDLCCSALNVLRQHSSLFLNLFSLMVNSHIPGVNENAVKYVQKALLPEHSDAEVTAIFTRMIDESLRSTFTQINFFLHNLAQMKFSGHTEGALLSFIPKTYSIHTDGKISRVEIYGYQKRYNPEKYYIYILKVDRVKQTMPSFVFRRYSEFQELHQKLLVTFPLAKLPSLSGRVFLGRTHVRSVAAARKEAVETFIKHLFSLEPEISENDIVYTFFHPMLRDEQDVDKTNLTKLKEKPCTTVPDLDIQSQIKLSLFYKNMEFTVMVMHVKDLVAQDDEAPDPYVKLYLLPDPMKLTKRKTKIAKGTLHPTYNEMLLYRMPMADVNQRQLQVTVWNYDALKENEFLGAIVIDLADINLSRTTTHWYRLHMHR